MQLGKKKPQSSGKIKIAEERYITVRQAEFILGSNKIVPAEDLKTGYLHDELNEGIENCDVGYPDKIPTDLKKEIFLNFSILTNRLVVLLDIRAR